MWKPFPKGKEAEDGVFVSRGGGGGSTAGALVLRGVAAGRSYPQSVRRRKCDLAGLGLYAGNHRMGLPRAVSQCRSFLSHRGGAADRLAYLAGSAAVCGGYRSVLHSSRQPAGRSHSPARPRDRHGNRRHGGRELALAGAQGAGDRRVDDHHARHRGQPGGLSAAEEPEARLRFSPLPASW